MSGERSTTTPAAALVSFNLQDLARRIDKRLKRIAGRPVGFILLVWEGGEVNYVGTDHDRANVIKAMREIIAKWESGVSDTPAHLRH